MISDAIECFNAKVERFEDDIGTPYSVVVTAGYERIEGIFACMPAWAMAAIVAESDCFGERDVEAKAARYRSSNLCDFECVSEPRSLMVVGKNKDLCFARKATECWGMENAIAIAFKTGSKLVGFFLCGSVARSGCSSGPVGKRLVVLCFTFFASDAMSSNRGRRTLAMSEYQVLRSRGPFHSGHPFLLAWCSGGR